MKETEHRINAIIDGIEVECQKGKSILEAANQVGIKIPTLCYSPDLKPTGVCRICVVEVEGAKTLVGSCHTLIDNGMTIHTRSPKVLKARRSTVELSMAGHTGECVTDMNASNCELRKLADLIESGAPKFLMRKPRWYPIEEFNPYVRRDMSRCILCRKCIGACQEIAKKNIFGIAYRGFASKVVVDFDEALTTDACRNCGICIEYCPTGALSKPKTKSETK
jgi:NADH dehydrogenase/NADH:ubiquinone oxidoreductase subunit G